MEIAAPSCCVGLPPPALKAVYLCTFVPGVQHSRLVGRRAQRRRGHRPQGLPTPSLHPLSSNRYRGYTRRHQHYGPLPRPNTHKRSPWCSSRWPSRYFQSLTRRLWRLPAAGSGERGNLNASDGPMGRNKYAATKA